MKTITKFKIRMKGRFFYMTIEKKTNKIKKFHKGI